MDKLGWVHVDEMPGCYVPKKPTNWCNMSFTSLYEFENGIPKYGTEFKNSWGGAAYIWTHLYDKYLKDPDKEYDDWLIDCTKSGRGNRLWDLAKDKNIPFFMRAVHVLTFDRAIVKRENFHKIAQHLREFVNHFGEAGICHLNKWAEVFENSEAEAIGFWMTSTSNDLWFDEGGEGSPYNLNERTDHFEVYEELEKYNV